MSNRFGRDTSRNALFSNYDRSSSPSKNKSSRPSSGYGFAAPSAYSYTPPSSEQNGPAFSAYPGANGSSSGGGLGGGFRSATPNSRGQYSNAVLDELESQNEEQVGVLTGKVRQLKDLTSLIGDEIRDSTALAEKMNDSFDSTRLKLRGTMNRMLRMAQRTGVGWKVWLGFFAAVILLFWYVWLF
ncbi:hypothetical protein CC78DRAFT_535478 [Lojkania enalia]|uniref:t-SNARE coiled-coil homology domain-containing protein n=1 Tax=Lojkania enalia TaxID=147567 RepID=A0A9P4K299_9PLEO|nr:hypothetical protein CC78DRAFT_535478 [Didymosphaeria enalia]